MTKRNQSKIKDISIAVFAFAKDSQVQAELKSRPSYIFIYNMMELLMKKHSVSSAKIGFTGYKDDIAAYFSALMELYLYRNIDVSLLDATEGFDPDIMQNNI